MSEERRNLTSVGARMRGADNWGGWSGAQAPAGKAVAAAAPVAAAEPASVLRDALTGLPNHLLLPDRLDCALKRGARGRQRVAVAVLDLVGAAAVAEQHGAAAADALVLTTAQRLTLLLRASDTVARLGAREFAVVLEGMHSAAIAAQVAQKLLAGVTEPCMLLAGAEGRPVKVEPAAVIGVAVSPDHGRQRDELLAAAMLARNHARRAGGVQLYREGVEEPTAAVVAPRGA
jgi:diguanylate cyclase (GGDEF)-like protein